jgi:hypothetical protein
MKPVLLAAVFIPLLVGYSYYLGGLGFGGDVVGLVLFTYLIVSLPGAFRARNYRERQS